MDWRAAAESVGKYAPLLGTLLGGPAAGAVGSIIAATLGVGSSPDDISRAMLDPESAVKIKSLESSRQVELQTLIVRAEGQRLIADSAAAQSINATMRAETAAEHWPSYSWRPFIGFMFGTYIGSLFLLPLFGVTPVVMSADMVFAVAAILGVASFFRGKMQADPTIPSTNRG